MTNLILFSERSRKEPTVEKELKPEVEKPKKGARGGKRKVEKIEEEESVESTPQEEGDNEDDNATAKATEGRKPSKKLIQV